MKILTRSLIAMTLLAPAFAQGANWERVAQNGTTTVNVDLESIVKLKSGNRKAWVEYLMNSPEKSSEGKSYSRIVNLYNFDCGGRRSAIEREVLYDAVFEGKVVQDIKIPRTKLQFEDSVPDSFAEVIVGFVCKAKLPK